MSGRLSDQEFVRLRDDLKQRVPISSVFGSSLKLIRAGREYKACCPFHQDRTPSFTVNDEKGFYHCFGCGAHGDALDAVQALHGVGLLKAVEMLSGGEMPAARPEPMPKRPDAERDTVGEARAIWRSSVSAEGTPVQSYLSERGLYLPIPPTIRFARLRYGSRGDPMPCLVALVTSPDNKLCGIQRTFLAPDGRGKADVPKAKLSLGRVRGGAIRLAPAAAELLVAEGLEDALTLQQELGAAAWAAGGASMLPGMEFPSSVRSVVIGRDNDEAGERSAQTAASAFSDAGVRIRIMQPLPGCKDFNEQLTRGVPA